MWILENTKHSPATLQLFISPVHFLVPCHLSESSDTLLDESANLFLLRVHSRCLSSDSHLELFYQWLNTSLFSTVIGSYLCGMNL